MRIFVTGATGFIGMPVVKELIGAGHQVLGMARSDGSAKSLAAAGAEVHRGRLEDLESLRRGAAQSDGVVHLAFNHDAFTGSEFFSNFQKNCQDDKQAIEAMGAVLSGSDRPFIVSSGTGLLARGITSTEDMDPRPDLPLPRVSEQTAMALLAKGVKVSVMRFGQIHDPYKAGLVTPLIHIARQKGVSAYVGEGRNRWPAAHVSDVARLYKLVLEKHQAGAKYHAVAEEGVALREIAESIGRGLNIPVVSKSPEEAGEHFGWLAMFVSADIPSSSQRTRERFGWQPTGPGLISDLNQGRFAEPEGTSSQSSQRAAS